MVSFWMKLWCELELYVISLRISIRVRFMVMVPCDCA